MVSLAQISLGFFSVSNMRRSSSWLQNGCLTAAPVLRLGIHPEMERPATLNRSMPSPAGATRSNPALSWRASREAWERELRDKVENVLDDDLLVCDYLPEYLNDGDKEGEIYSLERIEAGCRAALKAKKQAEKEWAQWLASYSTVYDQLEALDQLFIAV